MKHFFYLIVFLAASFLSFETAAQSTTARVQIFRRDTVFRNIAVDASGNVYALTNRKGMVKFDQQKWQDWNGPSIAFAKSSAWQLATKGDEVWVASSGYVLFLGSGADGNNNNFYGGVLKFDSKNSFKSRYYKGKPVLGQKLNQGPPTRNILGIYIDTNGVPWCAGSYQDSVTYPAIVNYNARYYFAPGAVGRFNGTNFDFITGPDLPDPTGIQIGVGNSYKDDSYSIGKRRTCRSITQVGNEMWAGSDGYDQADNNLITAGILRYDLAGRYLGKYDEINSGIPFGLTNTSMGPWALYADKTGRAWVSMNGFKGIAVRDTNNIWYNIGVPGILPTNTIFRSNGIAGNSRGEVYFATNNGLLVYKGKGSFRSDTSYYVYNTGAGLSSNSIFGVAAGRDGSVWLATDAGINKITGGDLIVYNLSRDFFSPSNTSSDEYRRPVATYNSKSLQEEIEKDTLFIAADSSKATVIKYSGSDPKHMAFRIKDDAAQYDPRQHGRFVVNLDPELNDSIRVQYYHPSYINDLYTVSSQFNGKNVRLQMVDTTVTPERMIFNIPVKIVLPPVLLVHGIWSDGTTWDVLKEYLFNNGLYQYKPYEVATPSYPNAMGFSSNYRYIQGFIRALLEKCSYNRISAGRVDVVTHSMGGILSRLYLQDEYGYQNDIHKLITINTPHSGSPLANIVEDKDRFFRWSMGKFDYNTYFGALSDLAIGHSAIDSYLNGKNINKHIVPSHVIHTIDQFSDLAEFANDLTNAFVKSPTKSKSVISAATKISLVLIKYYLTKNTSCHWDTRPNDCIQQIYGGNSDLIVSDTSQKGGIAANAQTFINGLNHLNVLKSPLTSSAVLKLLREDTRGADFSNNGFNPGKFKWDAVRGTVNARKSSSENDSVRIIYPSYGAAFNRGDSVHVIVRASNGIKRILFFMGYENDIDAFGVETPDSVFSFKVPDDVLNRINYSAIGFDASGNEFTDSSYIIIAANPALVLDSIKIEHSEIDDLKIPIGDSTNIIVWGYFNDGVKRNITYEPGLTFSTAAGSVIVSNDGFVNGLLLGFDDLIAAYGGKSDNVYLEVVPKTSYEYRPARTLPVRFVKVTAKFTGNEVVVQWNTAMEQNNDHFEIEHSIDGIHFSKAGSMAANNLTNGSAYTFNDPDYATGKNYYRIKQVDKDGHSSYSEIVVALVILKNNISFYPNPVSDELIIDFSKAGYQTRKTIMVYNTLGQSMITKIVAARQSKISINTAVLAPGIYTVEVQDADKKTNWKEKFIKNRK